MDHESIDRRSDQRSDTDLSEKAPKATADTAATAARVHATANLLAVLRGTKESFPTTIAACGEFISAADEALTYGAAAYLKAWKLPDEGPSLTCEACAAEIVRELKERAIKRFRRLRHRGLSAIEARRRVLGDLAELRTFSSNLTRAVHSDRQNPARESDIDALSTPPNPNTGARHDP